MAIFLPQRTQRPQRLCERCVLCVPHDLIAGAMTLSEMTLSEMTVLGTDEILLRIEISRMRKEGTRRRTSGRARRGCGRDKRGPPVWRRAISLRNGRAGGARRVATAPLLQFYISTRKDLPISRFCNETWHFCHKEHKDRRESLRPLRQNSLRTLR